MSGAASAAPPAGFRTLRAFFGNPAGAASLAFMAAIILLALAAPLIFPEDPLAMVARPLLWPGENAAHPLGTDSLGRDVAAGIVWGARVSLLVGLAAMLLGVAIGVAVGAVAGYFGGRTDTILVKIIEIFQTPPGFLLLVVLMAIVQPSITNVVLAIGGVSWTTTARLVRAEFRSLRGKDFVTAARGLGYGHVRIMLGEMLPNALPPIIVSSSVLVATAILMESALSFLGLSDPNVVSWGSMIGAGREMLRTAWFLSAMPGLAIVATVLALNMLGDALNDALNPHLSGNRRT